MKTITSNNDITLFIEPYINDYSDVTYVVFTDSDSSYTATNVVELHGTVKIPVPSTILKDFCTGQIKVKVTSGNVEKTISTDYYLDNLDIDNNIHLPQPYLVNSEFVFDGNTLDLFKHIVNLDTTRVTYEGAKERNAGTYTLKATAHGNFDFGRGVTSVSFTYTIKKLPITIPSDKEYEYDGTTKVIPDTDWVEFLGDGSAVGTYDVIARLKEPTNTEWSDGTTDDKTAHLVIVDKYYTKTEQDAKFAELQASDETLSNTLVSNVATLTENDANLKKQIDASKAEVERALELHELSQQAINEEQAEKNTELEAKIANAKKAVEDELTASEKEQAQTNANLKASDAHLQDQITANKTDIATNASDIKANKKAQEAKNTELANKDTELQQQITANKTDIATNATNIKANKTAQDAKNTELDDKDKELDSKIDTTKEELKQSIEDSISDLATVATSGSYNDLTDKPTSLSEFSNATTKFSSITYESDGKLENMTIIGSTVSIGSKSINLIKVKFPTYKSDDVWHMINWDSLESYLTYTYLKKADLPTKLSQFTNDLTTSWNDLTDRPSKLSEFTNDLSILTLSDLTWTNIIGKPTKLSEFTNDLDLNIVTSWNDLTDKPTKLSQFTNDLNIVTSWDDLEDKPTLATVATSGSYNDLKDKPNFVQSTDGSVTNILIKSVDDYDAIENPDDNTLYILK